MTHVGDELRLVLAGDFEFTALLGDLFEKTHILYGNDCLISEGGYQGDLFFSEWLNFGTSKEQTPDRFILTKEWYGKHRPVPS